MSIGKHTTIEMRTGTLLHLFPGDRIVGAFGNRYATDQYEGYTPSQPVEFCDMLSVGGLVGRIASQHSSMGAPTRLRILGSVCDAHEQPFNLKRFGLPPHGNSHTGEIILVVGAAMNAGKTTTVGTIVRALTLANLRVAAAKVTGTAAGKDERYFISCGAKPVLDFTDAGYPSTYMLELDELLTIYTTILAHLRSH